MNYLNMEDVEKKGSLHVPSSREIRPQMRGRKSFRGRDAPERRPQLQSRSNCFAQPPPRGWRGAGVGAGPGPGGAGPPPRARRLDDHDKMTTLKDGLLGSDPGALSAEQLEKLRDYKVGALPPSPPPKRGSPRIRAQTGRRTPREGIPFPIKGGKARGEARRLPGRSSGERLKVQEELK